MKTTAQLLEDLKREPTVDLLEAVALFREAELVRLHLEEQLNRVTREREAITKDLELAANIVKAHWSRVGFIVAPPLREDEDTDRNKYFSDQDKAFMARARDHANRTQVRPEVQ